LKQRPRLDGAVVVDAVSLRVDRHVFDLRHVDEAHSRFEDLLSAAIAASEGDEGMEPDWSEVVQAVGRPSESPSRVRAGGAGRTTATAGSGRRVW